jgi:hypothetical protein
MIHETTVLQLEKRRRALKVEIGSLVERVLNFMFKEDQCGSILEVLSILPAGQILATERVDISTYT